MVSLIFTRKMFIFKHSVLDSCTYDKTPGLKATWRGKGLFPLTAFGPYSITEGSPGGNSNRNLEAGTEAAETVEGYCLLARRA